MTVKFSRKRTAQLAKRSPMRESLPFHRLAHRYQAKGKCIRFRELSFTVLAKISRFSSFISSRSPGKSSVIARFLLQPLAKSALESERGKMEALFRLTEGCVYLPEMWICILSNISAETISVLRNAIQVWSPADLTPMRNGETSSKETLPTKPAR